MVWVFRNDNTKQHEEYPDCPQNKKYLQRWDKIIVFTSIP